MKNISVSEFNKIVSDKVSELGHFLVEGEINEWKIYRGKVIYFTLKDEKATVNCQTVIFKVTNWRELEEGMKVRAVVEPKYNQTRGQFSAFASQVMPVGEGALKIALEKLKKRLTKEGLFEEERKRALPRFPQKVGLITSRESEAIKDFKKIISESYSQLKIYHFDARVEGKNAKDDILAAFDFFNTFNQKLDAVVLTRGGGSLESLKAFNEEEVVKAVAGSKYPVVCGVGHEGDVSLADLAADVRASTPTNCAEILVENWNRLPEKLDINRRKIVNAFSQKLSDNFNRVESIQSGISHSMKIGLKNCQHQLVDNFSKIKNVLSRLLESQRQLVERFKLTRVKIGNDLESKKEKIERYLSLIKSQNPENILKMGYSITINKDGEVIKSIKKLEVNQELLTKFSDGKVKSKINQIKDE
jgi:exodeoxyribonuclease VII large subunit